MARAKKSATATEEKKVPEKKAPELRVKPPAKAAVSSKTPAKLAKTADKSAPPPKSKALGKGRKSFRYRPGRRADKEIVKQIRLSATTAAIRLAPFIRLVREIAQDFPPPTAGDVWRFQKSAIQALQVATEHYGIGIMKQSKFMANVAKRVTIQREDVRRTLLFPEVASEGAVKQNERKYLDAVKHTYEQRQGLDAKAEKQRQKELDVERQETAAKREKRSEAMRAAAAKRKAAKLLKEGGEEEEEEEEGDAKEEDKKEPVEDEPAAAATEVLALPAPEPEKITGKRKRAPKGSTKAAVRMAARDEEDESKEEEVKADEVPVASSKRQMAAAASALARTAHSKRAKKATEPEPEPVDHDDSQAAFRMEVAVGSPEPSSSQM